MLLPLPNLALIFLCEINKVHHISLYLMDEKTEVPLVFSITDLWWPIGSKADLFFVCLVNLNPELYFVRQRTKCSFMTVLHCWTVQTLCTGNTTGHKQDLMQWTSVCRQQGFRRQEGWNIHYLLSFDNEATWQWSHFQMSEVHKCRRELTLHNFCLFHSALRCQSKADSQNSTEQLDERLQKLCDENSVLEKGTPTVKKKHIVCKYGESRPWIFNFQAT